MSGNGKTPGWDSWSVVRVARVSPEVVAVMVFCSRVNVLKLDCDQMSPEDGELLYDCQPAGVVD